MPFIPFDNELRRATARDKFIRETGITKASSGGKARALFDAVMNELEAVERATSERLSQLTPEGANGSFLEIWADFLGEKKEGAEVAHADAADQVVKFYTETGTFGDLNGGADITLPATSTILSGKKRSFTGSNVEINEVEYRLTGDVTLAAGDSSKWISVIALGEGQGYNISANQLIGHNFTNFTAYPAKSLLVTNVEPIANGEDPEDDSRLQSRILRANLAFAVGVEDKLLTLADAVPGVTDVFVIPFFSGPGTIDLFIDAATFTVPTSLISEVSTRISPVDVPGAVIRVYPVQRVGIALDIYLEMKAKISKEDEDALIERVRTATLESILNTPTGASYSFKDLHQMLSFLSNQIRQVGTPAHPFSSILIYRDAQIGRIAEQWDTSTLAFSDSPLMLERYERLYVEESLAQPINITVGYL